MISRRTLESTLIFIGLYVVITLSGCKITSDDLETWKGTVKGPGKIVAVLLTKKYDLALRTRAAMSLIEMERQDIDGVAELQNAAQNLDEESRVQIIANMLPELDAMMADPADSKSKDMETGPSPHQVRAKDASFLMVAFADAPSRDKLTKSIINWYVKDFQGRNLTGNYSAEQVVRALGAPAATVLVDALSSKLAQPTLIKIAELVSQLGSATAKANAAHKLVAIENEMESDAYLAWLQNEIAKQLKDSKEKSDPAFVLKTAELNRHKYIVDGALPAMKNLANQKEVADRLIQIASVEGKDARLTEKRVCALQALEGNATKDHLQSLLALALSTEAPVSVRDYAFDRVADIRSPDAIPPMWPLVKDAKEQRLRWRAGELVLAIGGPGILAQFFSALPGGKDVAYAPEELEGYASRLSQMNPLPIEIARAQLSSPSWWNRVIAINFFDRRGTKDDIDKIKKLVADKTKVTGKGWKDDDTVGKVAENAVASLQERLK
jgi:hypothetical protein